MAPTPINDEPTFVPSGFAPPLGLSMPAFTLEPLRPQHNDSDYAAWTSSLAHIRATPGFEDQSWPHEMTLAENLGDLEMHARHFEERRGFTYTVLDPGSAEVIGCVYIYPARGEDSARAAGAGAGSRASVRSWVRADRAQLDEPLWAAVGAWLARDWPFAGVDYAPR